MVYRIIHRKYQVLFSVKKNLRLASACVVIGRLALWVKFSVDYILKYFFLFFSGNRI